MTENRTKGRNMRQKSKLALLAGIGVAFLLSACTIVIGTYSEVYYYANGNTAGTAPVDHNTYGPGDRVLVLDNTGNLTKNGYLFNGWNTSFDGSGYTYLPDETFEMGSSNVYLYARWKPWTILVDTWTMYFTRTADGSSGVRHWYLESHGTFSDDGIGTGSGTWGINGNSITLNYANNHSFPMNTYFRGKILADCNTMTGYMDYANSNVGTWFATRGYISAAEIEKRASAYATKKSGKNAEQE